MPAGLASPLHLAACLLALTAAVGLAVAAVAAVRVGEGGAPAGEGASRVGLRAAAAVLVAAGALVHAAGQGLSGALVATDGDLAGWLRAAGLAAVALGLAAPPPRSRVVPAETGAVRGLEAGPALVVPVATSDAAVLAAAAGALAVLRLVLGGPWRLVGAGVALLGAAEALARTSATLGALATLAGALLVGAWLSRSSRTRLSARFASAFVTTVLGVVVLLAVTLSRIGTADLLDDELARLGDRSASLAQEVGVEWPQQAVETVLPLRGSATSILGAAGVGVPLDERVREIYDAFFSTEQDLLVVFAGPDGSQVGASAEPGVATEELLEQLRESRTVGAILDGTIDAGGELLVVAGRIHAVGATRLDGPQAPAGPAEPLAGVLLAGRVVDEAWAADAALTDARVLVEAGTAPSVASSDVAPVAAEVLASLRPGATSQTVVLEGEAEARFVAASAVRLPDSGAVGRIVTLSGARGVAALERDQARRLFLLALLGTGVAVAVAVAVSRRLVAPIQRLTAVAAAVREGRLDVSARLGSPDEVGTLGRTFDEMTASLAHQSGQLRDAAAAQSRLRARLETLTASMGDALLAVDPSGTVLTSNPAAERLVGLPAADILGRRLSEVLVGSGPEGVAAAAAVGAPDSPEVIAVTLLLSRPDGRRLSVAATAAPVREPGQRPAGRVLVLRDRTRESEVERMKTEFLSNVSHELRTPLTPIRGYAEVLARRQVDDDARRRFAAAILDSTDRLERVVRLIVDFAALDSGKLQLRRMPIALPDLVGDVVGEWRARTPGREFRRRVPKQLPAVAADPAMLRRCLDELLDNAVKFSPDGGAVSVTASPESRTNGAGPGVSHDVVRLSVRDRGVGMEPESAGRAFADFYQADATETRHFGGLGLGLALVLRIVDGLGGEIAVDSVPGEGTTVHLLLPTSPVARVAAPARAAPARAPVAEVPGTSRRGGDRGLG